MREMLSVGAQQYFERQDIDAVLVEWQIPINHKAEFNELVAKGYLVPTTTGVNLKGYKFADDLIAAAEGER